jgi:hypothetical protein
MNYSGSCCSTNFQSETKEIGTFSSSILANDEEEEIFSRGLSSHQIDNSMLITKIEIKWRS